MQFFNDTENTWNHFLVKELLTIKRTAIGVADSHIMESFKHQHLKLHKEKHRGEKSWLCSNVHGTMLYTDSSFSIKFIGKISISSNDRIIM